VGVVAAVSLPACGGLAPAAQASPSTTAPVQSQLPLGLRISPRKAIVLGGAPVGGVAMWSHFVAWARESGSGLVPRAIEVYDDRTGSIKTVARSRDPRQIDLPRGDGDFLTYREGHPTDESRTPWTVHLLAVAQRF